MKILALVGSNRKKGNTTRIVQLIETRMQSLAQQHDTPLEFETIFLGDLDIHPCRGCRLCFDRGENACPLKDDIVSLRAKMDAVDGLILASPVYVDDVSGLVKTWMDRLAFVCHRPAFSGKCAYPIATVGGSSPNHTLRTMNAALLTWGFHLVGQAGFKMGALASPDEMERYEPEATKVAEALFRAVSQRHASRPALVSLIAFKIQQLAWQREPPDSYDYAYWDGRGWLANERTFYTGHRAHPIKVALARLLGAVIFRFVV
ncbi:MAG: flavodoxin family protein [Chloroflexi bacterium]|nr:flavodoxin family protein [Chloroflexota bacterium]